MKFLFGFFILCFLNITVTSTNAQQTPSQSTTSLSPLTEQKTKLKTFRHTAFPKPNPTEIPKPLEKIDNINTDIPEDYQITERAKTWISRIENNDIKEEELAPEIRASFKEPLSTDMALKYKILGEPQNLRYVGLVTSDNIITYIYVTKFEAGTILLHFSINAENLIAQIRFVLPIGIKTNGLKRPHA